MSSPAAPAPSTLVPARESLDPKYTWDLSSIFPSWDAWETAFTELDRGIEAYKKYEGTLAQGREQLLRALKDRDALGQLSYASGITRRCNTTRTSATTPSTRGGSGCSC